MNFTPYIHGIYAILVWAFVFIVVKPKRIKELWPVAALAFFILFIAEEYLISLHLYSFNKPWLSIYGIPFLHLVWGAGSGIVVMHYMKKDFAQQLVMVLIFTVATLAFEYFPEHLGAASHLGSFTETHDAFQDSVSLILLVWISDGLWGDRIYSRTISPHQSH